VLGERPSAVCSAAAVALKQPALSVAEGPVLDERPSAVCSAAAVALKQPALSVAEGPVLGERPSAVCSTAAVAGAVGRTGLKRRCWVITPAPPVPRRRWPVPSAAPA